MPATSAAALKRKRERAREYVREWKKRNQEKVLAQKQRYRKENKDKRRDELNRWRVKNPEKVREQKRRHRERKAWPRIPRTWPRNPRRYDQDKIVLLDARVELIDCRKSATQNLDEFNPEDILKGLFSSKAPERKECDSTNSETDEELMNELLTEIDDPVQHRLKQIKKNRKKAENNRIDRMIKNRKEEDMFVEIAAELD